jgi:hypothetical protein
MTAFITRCWKNIGLELKRSLVGLVSAATLSLSAAWAQTSSVDLMTLRPAQQNGDLVLHAQLALTLGPAVEDALIKGLAVHFVADAEVLQERWYWTDKRTGAATRYYRLAFQPLTRRWRLNVSTEPISNTGLAGSISQSFDTLSEALNVIGRQSAWKIANMQDVRSSSRQRVRYEFKLDVSQLPRPFQIAAGNQADWRLQVRQTISLNLQDEL